MLKYIIKYFTNNYKTILYPIDRRMDIIKTLNIKGMNTENIRFIINDLVKKYAKTYLEIGTYQGSSIISAAIFNNNVRCIAIDNFSQFDNNGVNKSILLNNIKNAEINNIELIDKDYKIAITELFKNEPNLKIDIYFYDGNHSYENQLNGLNIIKPYLSKSCIIFIDDTNYDRVLKANQHWLTENTDFKSFNIDTPKNGHNTWWNGFSILYRNIEF